MNDNKFQIICRTKLFSPSVLTFLPLFLELMVQGITFNRLVNVNTLGRSVELRQFTGNEIHKKAFELIIKLYLHY